MTSNVHIRRVSSPAYYLARPAALWLAAFAPRPADPDSCATEREGSSPTAHEATL